MKRKLLLVCAITLATWPCWAQTDFTSHTAAASPAQIDAQKEADIRRLMEVTGAGGLGLQAMNTMESSVRPLLESSLPAGAYRARLIDLFFQKFHAEATQEALINLIVPVYDRHFSDQEVQQLISFYESPIGKKAVTALPQIMSESQQAGSTWGKELGRKCMQEVLAENPDLGEQMLKAQHPTTPHAKKTAASH